MPVGQRRAPLPCSCTAAAAIACLPPLPLGGYCIRELGRLQAPTAAGEGGDACIRCCAWPFVHWCGLSGRQDRPPVAAAAAVWTLTAAAGTVPRQAASTVLSGGRRPAWRSCRAASCALNCADREAKLGSPMALIPLGRWAMSDQGLVWDCMVSLAGGMATLGAKEPLAAAALSEREQCRGRRS